MNAAVELPKNKEPVLRVMPMPSDVNSTGDIFGGWIMAQVDIAGGIPAFRVARGRVATVAVNSFVFRQPVLVGDLVSFYADVVRVGRTSITVAVEVFAQRDMPQRVVKVTEATLTYVAVDAERRPRPVSPD
ncbi:MAG: acyl-CoA thioesterase [Betaproteobacteria bacterium]|nr:acyl-CoA thioesterase [Betaproteobacteria bacterium]